MQIHAVPQWQGALTERASLLPASCCALAELAADVLGAPVREIEVATGGGDCGNGIANRDVLIHNLNAQRQALAETHEPVLTIGGDCGVELAPLETARQRYGDGLTALWFDAHVDLNTPRTSPSGAFHGMVLRAALGDGDDVLVADPALSKWRVLLAGARTLDAAEQELIPHIQPDPTLRLRNVDLCAPENVGYALEMLQAHEVYLHIDLDVLDPTEFDGLNCPEPGGITVGELADSIRALADGDPTFKGRPWPVVAVGVTECTTTDPVELRTLVPILEAIGAALA
ncbi:MAG: arginase [Acidimicrobiales bacterium]|nr:MAG: arginase [Acidimicrobiales bacterium]